MSLKDAVFGPAGDRRFNSADFAAEKLWEGVIGGNERRQRVLMGRSAVVDGVNILV